MGGHRKPSLNEEIENLDRNSEEYKAIMRRYEAINKAENEKQAQRHKMVIRILELTQPLKDLSVSKLSTVSNSSLIEIGKAARALNEAIRASGMKRGGFSSDKWSEF